MNRFLCISTGLAWVVGFGFASHAEPITAFVETDLKSSATCIGDFKSSAERAQKANIKFGDTLAKPIITPIVWNNFRGERELFGYLPSFTPNRISFATNGRPVIRDRELNLQILMDDGRWMRIPLLPVAMESLRRQGVVSAANPWVPKYVAGQLFGFGPHSEERVVFDEKCRAYTVVDANYSSLGRSFLLYSKDGGHSWAAYPIPQTNDPLYTTLLEAPVNGTLLRSPPALVVAEKYDPAAANGVHASNAHKAWLLLPVLSPSGTLSLAGPFLITDHTLCCGSHSGFEAQAVSYGDHIHIAYPDDRAEIDPITRRLGTPQYVRTFSRKLGRFVNDPVFVGTGLLGPQNQPTDPAHDSPDSHSQTALAVDQAGFIHIVIAGHGSRMVYRKSVQSDDNSNWSSPEVITLQPKAGNKSDFVDEYTYASLVLDSAGQPNVLARWSGEGYRFRLVYTFKSNRTGAWSPQQVLLDPGRAYYGVWYHKMTIDPWDRIFVSYSYYPDNLFSDEAENLAKQHGFVLGVQASTPPCLPTRSTDPKPNYCHFLGYGDMGGSILMRRPRDETFALASTREFFSF